MSLTVYDARVHHCEPNRLARPEPLGKTQLCLNAGNIVTLAGKAAPQLPLPGLYSYVAKAFRDHTGITLNGGGDDFLAPTPLAALGLIEVDGEDWFTPEFATGPIPLKSITSSLKLTGVHITTSPPEPFGMTIGGVRYGMQNDDWLKQPTYVANEQRLAEMKAWRKLHLPWINDLFALTFCVYFDPIAEHDEIWFNYLNNCLLAIRSVYGANQRVLCHTWAHRNTGQDNPPALPDATIQRWAGALLQASARGDMNLGGVIIWNDDDKCGMDPTKKLLMALGVEGVV